MPDERLGARVAAVVEVRDRSPVAPPFDVDALRAHCRGNIARYKIPEAFVLAPLPRNAMGKVSVPDVRRSLEGLDLDAAGAPDRPGPQ
jgi:acyl-CoA synthetase (AMP-forming)/AMP-acid ligase II